MEKHNCSNTLGLSAIIFGSLLACLPVAYADETVGSAKTHSVQLRKLVFKVDVGTSVGSEQTGPSCMYKSRLVWQGDQEIQSLGPVFNSAFIAELKQDDYRIVDDPDNLFDDSDQETAEYEIAGVIDNIHVDICYPLVAFQDFSSVIGDAYIHVAWQLYSVLDHKVVYQSATAGTYRTKVNMHDPHILLQKAFVDAGDQLLKDVDFRNMLTQAAASPDSGDTASGPPAEPIAIAALKRSNLPLSKHLDAVRETVVTVFSPSGIGSGVIISKDGYILTDAHVVGSAESVKVKLVGGEEMAGTVLRKDKRRDVALVKVQAENMAALPVRASDLEMGDDVYALGSSLGTYESTLTKGIVSAYRDQGGNKYIQSDVNVQHGNSGGALMDADGNLIGLTEGGIEISGAPAGVNFFNPIMDSLAALNIVTR